MESKVIDQVSAQELLQALKTIKCFKDSNNNTIKDCSQQKVNKSSSKRSEMNFEIYMNRKNTTYEKQNQNVGKENIQNKCFKNKTVSSRSCSPIDFGKKKQLKIKPAVQKENKKLGMKNQSKITFISKKILREKQKRGNAYIPIQQRSANLIQQKKLKMDKIQKEKEISKIIEQKEWTFQPKILKGWRKIEKTNELSKATIKNELEWQQIEKSEIQETTISKKRVENEQMCSKRYKNDKFNMLLDLIK